VNGNTKLNSLPIENERKGGKKSKKKKKRTTSLVGFLNLGKKNEPQEPPRTAWGEISTKRRKMHSKAWGISSAVGIGKNQTEEGGSHSFRHT